MRKAEMEEAKEGVKIAGKTLNNLRYADDTTLVAGKKAYLAKLIRRLKRESEKAGLYFNIKKTKIMTTAKWDRFEIDGEEIEVVTSFMFLESEVEKEGRCDKEIKRRVAIGKATMIGLEKSWRDKYVSINTKKGVMRSLIFPTVLYGCETWTTTKKMVKKRSMYVRCGYGGRCKEYHGRRKSPMKVYAWRLE